MPEDSSDGTSGGGQGTGSSSSGSGVSQTLTNDGRDERNGRLSRSDKGVGTETIIGTEVG
ncbi:hypothetical protein DL98DRAFT_600736 [Cadophora sp. DSE1049]|nr:hypothetical protein DL98DRAFT_600736 [Cadophora sp. DSE1049]